MKSSRSETPDIRQPWLTMSRTRPVIAFICSIISVFIVKAAPADPQADILGRYHQGLAAGDVAGARVAIDMLLASDSENLELRREHLKLLGNTGPEADFVREMRALRGIGTLKAVQCFFDVIDSEMVQNSYKESLKAHYTNIKDQFMNANWDRESRASGLTIVGGPSVRPPRDGSEKSTQGTAAATPAARTTEAQPTSKDHSMAAGPGNSAETGAGAESKLIPGVSSPQQNLSGGGTPTESGAETITASGTAGKGILSRRKPVQIKPEDDPGFTRHSYDNKAERDRQIRESVNPTTKKR